MNISLRNSLAVLAILGACGSAFAAEPAEAARLDALKSTLLARFPDAKIQSISPSVLPGIYEVVSANLIVYSDISGEYVLMGPLIEARGGWNLTEERLGEINGIDFAALPFSRAIRIVKGSGRRRLAVFADPFCPFCRELEQTLAGITDVTIDVFLLPLEGIHPGATQKARDIWCSADPGQAWTGWMLRDQAVPAATGGCDADPVATIVQLARDLRINSTPTLVFGNGMRMDGALPAEQLERLLDRALAPKGPSR